MGFQCTPLLQLSRRVPPPPAPHMQLCCNSSRVSVSCPQVLGPLLLQRSSRGWAGCGSSRVTGSVVAKSKNLELGSPGSAAHQLCHRGKSLLLGAPRFSSGKVGVMTSLGC